ncbi:MAG TPA: nucleotidyl transferase AbiEii/AbiGii toxin family protein [Blastocatellia bacterium]|nr:nucleotidyl transferase AbiEii/AbiGii toxin family protein [Blastocatellia bacterium]
MFNADVLTFREFAIREPLPLVNIQSAVMEFLRGRDDVTIFGAQAVNAYVDEPRMTQDIDLLSTRAADLAEEIRNYLGNRFRIDVRVREIGGGRGYRVYQVRKAGNRNLVDVRPIACLPATNRIEDVLVMAPADLVASKVIAYHQRRDKPKSGTDWRDIAMLLLAFPELKSDTSPVTDRLKAAGAEQATLEVWHEIVRREIEPPDDEDDF